MFKCDKCGLCCKQVGKFPFMRDYNRGDGTCKFLTDDNTCSIYERRPPICNTELLYERIYSRVMTREEFDRMNTAVCEKLKSDAKTTQR